MRILLYCPNYLPATRYGGPIRSSHGLAKALVDQGHEVHVVTTNVDGPELIDVPLGVPVSIDGVSVRYFATRAPRRLYFSPLMGRSMEAEAKTFDVVHTNGMFLWPGPKAAAAATRARTPVVVSPRGMLAPELIAGRSTIVKKAWIFAFERRHLSQAKAIHVTSEEEAEGLRKMNLDRAPIIVIGNGVDPPEQMPDQAAIENVWNGIPSGSRVAFLGRLDWTKGVDLAINACANVPGAKLLIAGPDQIGLRTQLEPTIKNNIEGPIARFIGEVNGVKKWALLAGADILLAPSVKESFGISVAEALLMGTPVVCTEGVGAKTIVDELNPRLVVTRSAESLSRIAAELLADDEYRVNLGRKYRSLMQRSYSWHTIASEMAKVYSNAANHNTLEQAHNIAA